MESIYEADSSEEETPKKLKPKIEESSLISLKNEPKKSKLLKIFKKKENDTIPDEEPVQSQPHFKLVLKNSHSNKKSYKLTKNILNVRLKDPRDPDS